MDSQPKPLVSWFGGKARMADIIASKLPPHKIYVEPFGGAAGVLMAKPPSYIEVYNDLHDGIVTLFKVVRDPLLCRQLLELLELTPYARTEWRECNAGWVDETDPVEKARKVYVALAQNFVGDLRNGSWSFGGPKSYNVAQTFYNTLENIKAVAKRFKTIQIECKPALEVINRWQCAEALIYLDPPYLPETRGRVKQYLYELDEPGHIELLEWCLKTPAMVILSGYPSKLYSEKLESAGWVREDYSALATSALRSSKNGLKAAPMEKLKRTECLWFSPASAPKTLWNLESEGVYGA